MLTTLSVNDEVYQSDHYFSTISYLWRISFITLPSPSYTPQLSSTKRLIRYSYLNSNKLNTLDVQNETLHLLLM